MNINDDHDYIPSLKLLPFGGFEVASLLEQLKNGKRSRDLKEETNDFSVDGNVASSGWLQSKIMVGSAG